MAKRELQIVLSAKNAMAAGLSKAKAAMQSFGKSALNIGAFFTKGFLAAGAAVVGFATKAITAYAAQEKAERALTGALTAHGEAGEALLPALKKIASAIQDETGVADEATLAGMAKMRMLGVQTHELEKAAKGTIALKSLGLEEAAAQKAVAMALQGNYEMLNRYVPALRDATSETEKANIVNDLFEKGYAQQADQLDTVAGQWNLLRGRIGDAWEEIGRGIAQNDLLMKSLKRAGEAVKSFTGSITDWVEGGGIVNLIAGFKLFFADVTHTFKLIGNTFKVAWAILNDSAETAINYVSGIVSAFVNLTVARFKYLGDYAAAAWEKIKRPGRKFKSPDTSEYEAAVKKLASAIKGENTRTTKQTEKALAERALLHEEHAKRIAEISEEQTKELIAHGDKVAAAAEAAAEAERKMAEETTITIRRETTKQINERLKGYRAELAQARKNKSEVESLAKSRVQAVIDQQRKEAEEQKGMAADAARAKRLEDRLKMGGGQFGVKLSKADQEFLDAFRKIEAAQKEFAEQASAETAIESQIKVAEDLLKVEEDMQSSLEHIEESIDKALAY